MMKLTQLTQIVYYNMEHRIITYPGVYPNKYIITEYGHVINPKS